MSVATEIFSGSDIDYVRIVLGQAGRFSHIVENNEPQIAINTRKLYTNFKDVTDIIGIWSGTDYYHSGTNLSLSGTFDYKQGEILTHSGTSLILGGDYLISYVHGDGLNNRDVQRCLDDADTSVQLFLYTREDVNYDTSTTIGNIVYALKINLAGLFAIQIMNMGNVIQSGFNYALGEVRIETKLWGEGMSAEVLLKQIENKVNGYLEWLKLFYHENISIIQILDRTKGEQNYHRKRAERMVRSGSTYEWVVNGITMSEQFKVIDPRW